VGGPRGVHLRCMPWCIMCADPAASEASLVQTTLRRGLTADACFSTLFDLDRCGICIEGPP
jgi:hypothetical protein